VEEILLLNMFYPTVDTCLSCEDIAGQICAMVCDYVMANFWRFLGPAFSARHAHHISDLHSKFARRPHHVSKYGRHPTCGSRD